jgi:hypothetical protein
MIQKVKLGRTKDEAKRYDLKGNDLSEVKVQEPRGQRAPKKL